MKIFSYNINGIRAAINKGFYKWLQETDIDILCLQELKAFPEQFDSVLLKKMGFFCEWHSSARKGYSGVGLISKEPPRFVKAGIGIPEFDFEGRVLRADFENFTQISVYVPSGSMGDLRQDFKMKFLHEFYYFTKNLLAEKPSLVISGDFNICHKPVDIHHPELHTGISGFLPEEREWLDSFVALGFHDTFRLFNSQPGQYSWWSYRQNSREKNYGWRIDYNFISKNLALKPICAGIRSEVFHSDHCPVMVELG